MIVSVLTTRDETGLTVCSSFLRRLRISLTCLILDRWLVKSYLQVLVIRAAKEKGIQVTCEVSPHHLFLTEDDADRIGLKRAMVKPPLVTAEDQKALWDNIDVIDCFATDHGNQI